MSTNPWIQHVKAVQRAGGLSYKEALIEGSKTYRRQQGGAPPDFANKLKDLLKWFKRGAQDERLAQDEQYAQDEQDELVKVNNNEIDNLIQDILNYVQDDLEGNLRFLNIEDIEELVNNRRLIDPEGVIHDLRMFTRDYYY